MRRVATESEFEALRAADAGFIFNDFTSGPNPQYNVLHAASCRWLARMNLGVAKIHFDADEDPAAWLNRTKGPEGIRWKRCATCGAAAGARAATPPRPAAQPAQKEPGAPAASGAGYLVLAPDAPDPAVRAWTATRLQLQGGEWQAEFKRQLVNAVSQLPTRDGGILHATFAAAGGEGFDIENVLFYNVGTGCFGASCGDGLRFERAFVVPQAPSGTFAHHHRYEVAPLEDEFRHWNLTRTIGEIATAPFAPLSTSLKPPVAWYATKRGDVHATERLGAQDRYGARLVLEVPEGPAINVAGIAKPLLDGLLAGLDHHDGSDLAYLAGIVAGELRIDPQEVGGLLMESGGTLFGPRTALRRWGQGVQWNPPDDLCVAAEILVQRIRASRSRLTGSLHRAEQV
jgi:hypothetical protein